MEDCKHEETLETIPMKWCAKCSKKLPVHNELLDQAREEAERDYYGTDYLDAKDKQEIFIQGAQFIINKLNELKTK